MKRAILKLSAVMMTAIMLTSCGNGSLNQEVTSNDEDVTYDEVVNTTDHKHIPEYERNNINDEYLNQVVYNEVTIGKQVWLKENLNVDKFRNGEPIPEAKTREEWIAAGENREPAWCYYDYEVAYGEKYGKLYNWYAVIDPRGLAPKGWRIPSDDDWGRLIDYLGSEKPHIKNFIAGSKMKSADGWLRNIKGESGNGTNESGFSGLPGGGCGGGIFSAYIGKNGLWWSSTEVDDIDAKYISLDNVMDLVGWHDTRKAHGFSVRCLKD